MLSRRCYSLVSNSLPYAAEEAGVPLVNHHDAAEDARACAGILVDIARRNSANSIAELYLSLGLNLPKQPAFDPAQGLSKATMSALAARTGSFAERTLERALGVPPGGFQNWPEEGPNPPCRTRLRNPDIRSSARQLCSQATSPSPGRRRNPAPRTWGGTSGKPGHRAHHCSDRR